MFTSITWNDYLLFITATLFVYYSIIAIRFYKWELLALTGIRRELKAANELSSTEIKRRFISDSYANNNPQAIPAGNDPANAALKSEITALFANGPETVSSDKLSDSLNAVIGKYPSLSIQQWQDLSRFIYEEAGHYFPGLLSQNDVEQLWFG